MMKLPGFPQVRPQLRRVRQASQRARARAAQPGFWRAFWFRHVWRQPIWYTDLSGITCRLYPEDDLENIFSRRQHFDDDAVLAVARKLVSSDATVFDVGANCGVFTLFVAQLVGVTGHVHVFEPTGSTFRRLTENINQFNDPARTIRLNRCAVGDHVGRATIHEYPPGYSGWNSLSPHGMLAGEKIVMPSASEEVPLVTLDQYCTERSIIRIDLLKVDVEGFEVEVLHGCARLLRENRIRHLIFEISVDPLKGRNLSAESVIEAVFDLGFEIDLIRPDGELDPVRRGAFTPPYFANYLATRRPH
jgi:FkbM family methyltransferase